MSMRGELISKEYQRMIFINDVDGKQYACYREDLVNSDNRDTLSENEKEKCMDLSFVIGDSW